MEREGISIVHPAKFIMIGSGNPAEGELRPQLLDRFGLSVTVATLQVGVWGGVGWWGGRVGVGGWMPSGGNEQDSGGRWK